MKTRLKQAYGAGALVALALTMGACQIGTKTALPSSAPLHSPSPSPSPLAPADALAVSIQKLATTSYNVKGTGNDVSTTGAVDATAKAAFLNLSTPLGSGQTLKMDTVLIDGKVYLKMDAGIANKSMHLNPKNWMLIDMSKVGKDVAMPLDSDDLSDPLDIDGLDQGVSNVTRIDATHYAGTIDLTQTGGVSSPDPADLSKVGSKAKTVPFTATLDAQGRLLSFTVNGSKISKALQFGLVFSNYGAATKTVKPAAGSTVNATSSLYSLLNG